LTHDASIVPSPRVSSSPFCTYEDDIGAGDFGFVSFLRIGYSFTNIRCSAKAHLARGVVVQGGEAMIKGVKGPIPVRRLFDRSFRHS
jgi:hypothetical protein